MGKDRDREKHTYVEHQKLSMIKFVNRVNLTLISSIFIVTALVYFLVCLWQNRNTANGKLKIQQ